MYFRHISDILKVPVTQSFDVKCFLENVSCCSNVELHCSPCFFFLSLHSCVWLWDTEHSTGQRCDQRLRLLLSVSSALSGSCHNVGSSHSNAVEKQSATNICHVTEHRLSCFCVISSPDGYMYDKQAILEYILHQKTEIAKKMKVKHGHVSSHRLRPHNCAGVV